MEAAAFLLVISFVPLMDIQNMTKEIKFQTPCTTEKYGNPETHSSK